MKSPDNTIAFLGPTGTYSHEATLAFAKRLGIESPDFIECTSFDEVFDCVDRGRCEFGVVAKENSIEGPVTATLDGFALKSTSVILGEEVVDIHHCLVVNPDAKLEDITTVASHAQGLAQCRRFMSEKLPSRTTVTTSSTAESARLAAADIHTAASRTPSPRKSTARRFTPTTSRTTSATRRSSRSSVDKDMRPCSRGRNSRRRSRFS